MLRVLLKRYRVRTEMIDRYLTGDLKEAVIPEIGRTSRHLQITLGTEWGREEVHPALWANAWAIEAGCHERPMNDSVRFPNEEAPIQQDLGGFTILIRRKGTHPIAFKWWVVGRLLYRWFGCMWGVHDSERTDRLRPNVIIDNDGTLSEFYAALDRVMAGRVG
jgi:hypothetical protein